MNFSEALDGLKEGKELLRTGWNGVHLTVRLVENILFSTKVLMLIKITWSEGNSSVEYFPWVPSHNDILAEDWEFI